ncbi:hypothetical protein CNMCM7691_007869 [Aspergillus felis]|uniref:Uncharacterized protein n=1 Tax=Aspergillus felis TaxID=1287682 RepID=A0A8H6V8H7_9EURO|nr:hypothetical protein CNMCM7691_007869 [Aspergillus felis]
MGLIQIGDHLQGRIIEASVDSTCDLALEPSTLPLRALRLGIKCETSIERKISCILAKPSEGQTKSNGVFGVDNGTRIKARYIGHIDQDCSRLAITKEGSQSRRPPVETVEDEQVNDEEEEELIKLPVCVILLKRSLYSLCAFGCSQSCPRALNLTLQNLIKPMVLAARTTNVTADDTTADEAADDARASRLGVNDLDDLGLSEREVLRMKAKMTPSGRKAGQKRAREESPSQGRATQKK